MQLHSPAADRNKDAILAVLRTMLPSAGVVLEIASGSGQHIVHWARALPQLQWQPTDQDPKARLSIAAWTETAALPNILAPLDLDVVSAAWPVTRADALVCLNMIHIAPPAATAGLLSGAARTLPKGAPMLVYGPFFRQGTDTAPSNLAFDASLRERNPAWGLRHLEDVLALAETHGLRCTRVEEMPANNLSLLLVKR